MYRIDSFPLTKERYRRARCSVWVIAQRGRERLYRARERWIPQRSFRLTGRSHAVLLSFVYGATRARLGASVVAHTRAPLSPSSSVSS